MAVMTFEDAVRKSIKAYWEDKEFEKNPSFEGKKYTKKYFDSISEEKSEVEKKSKKDK